MAEILETDKLNQGRQKLNNAIKQAENALTNSRKALSNSESTQKQLNQVVIQGDSSVEAAQARVDTDGVSHTTLKDRLDFEHVEVTNSIATKATETQVISENAYYHEISTKKYRDATSLTDYYLTSISNVDSDGKLIELKRGFASDTPNAGFSETARSFANRHNATLTLNASVFDTNTSLPLGTDIFEGAIIQENLTRNYYTLGIKTDNTLVAYPPGTTAQSILDDGCNNALSSFIPLIEKGASVSQSVLDTYAGGTDRHPRQVIAQFSNKDILIFTCEGRTQQNQGMITDDLIRILLAQGVDFAYLLDGGGSAQTVVRGSTSNTSVFEENEEEEGYIEFGERKVIDFLYISKPIKSKRDKDIAILNKDIGEVNRKANDLYNDLYYKVDMNNGYIRLKAPSEFKFQGVEVWEGATRKAKLQLEENRIGYFDYVNGKAILNVTNTGDITTDKGTIGKYNKNATVVTNANTITENGPYWITSGGSNTPDSGLSWSITHEQLDSQSAIQTAKSFTTPVQVMDRRKVGGSWQAWG
ncbi:phosphodiester glycosidase family protein [Ornithinibacillus xuwenensis]|uniref:Phosphodiester glycosidase family protein n=1 Tax=Ornithinibacillus xuwenensis TaxID=3144668 RepID=A0ABU9XC44_9BACI